MFEVSEQQIMKVSPNEKLNEAMYLWFTQKWKKGMPLSGPIIQEKARVMIEKLDRGSIYC